MKKVLALVLFTVGLASNAVAASKGPEIRIVDDKVSIQAEAVPLSRLLKLLDRVTGMTSKVPPELANRNVSVRFTDLTFEAAVRKIFQGQPLDYVLLPGQAIIVTGSSQTLTPDSSPTPYNPPPPPENVFVEDNPPFIPPQPMNNFNNNNNPQQQPAMIQTPFGPIANPRAQQQPQNVQPMVMPGQVAPQNNPFNQTLPGFGGGSNLPALQSNPQFGSPSQPPSSPGMSPSGFPNPMNPTNPTRPIP